jgi:DUF971 family protein
MLLPTKLERPEPNALRIHWSDGQVRRYTARELRDRCPCATCREKRTQASSPQSAAPASGLLTVLSPAEARPLTIEGMQPVGSYAYQIQFSDGHNTGIYTLEHLRQLGAGE